MNTDFMLGMLFTLGLEAVLWLFCSGLRWSLDRLEVEQLREQLDAAIDDYNKERQKVKSMKGRLKYLEKRNREHV